MSTQRRYLPILLIKSRLKTTNALGAISTATEATRVLQLTAKDFVLAFNLVDSKQERSLTGADIETKIY